MFIQLQLHCALLLAFVYQTASESISLCMSAMIQENCTRNNPMDKNGIYPKKGLYEPLFLRNADGPLLFGKHSRNHPHSCHLVQNGDVPNEKNKFLDRGCAIRPDVSLFRSFSPMRIGLKAASIVPYSANLAIPFTIQCYYVSCSVRKINDKLHECPDPFHCDRGEFFDVPEDRLRLVVSSGEIQFDTYRDFAWVRPSH